MPGNAMSTENFLNELRKVRTALFTIRVSKMMLKTEKAEDFLKLRAEVMNLVDKLEIENLEAIAGELKKNQAGFKDGIKALKKAIKDLNNAVRIINTISKVVGVVNKIAGIII